MNSSHLDRKTSWVPIEKCKTEITMKKESTSPSIKRALFPLTLAWGSTVHDVKGVSLEQVVIDFDLQKQKSYGPEKIYNLLNRVKNYNNLYCIGELKNLQ